MEIAWRLNRCDRCFCLDSSFGSFSFAEYQMCCSLSFGHTVDCKTPIRVNKVTMETVMLRRAIPSLR
jgi:hypothetical protein